MPTNSDETGYCSIGPHQNLEPHHAELAKLQSRNRGAAVTGFQAKWTTTVWYREGGTGAMQESVDVSTTTALAKQFSTTTAVSLATAKPSRMTQQPPRERQIRESVIFVDFAPFLGDRKKTKWTEIRPTSRAHGLVSPKQQGSDGAPEPSTLPGGVKVPNCNGSAPLKLVFRSTTSCQPRCWCGNTRWDV